MAVNMTIELLSDLLVGADQNITVDYCQVTPKRRRRLCPTVEYWIIVEGSTTVLSHTTPWSRSVVCKCLSVTGAHRNGSLADSLFSNEVVVYTKALPALLAFQTSRAPHVTSPFRSAPACYFARSDRLVLEDLSERGFKMSDRETELNRAQCSAALRELARLHALSVGMRRRWPQRFDVVVANAVHETIFAPEREAWYRNHYHDAASHVLSKVRELLSNEEGEEAYLENFESFIDSSTFFGQMVSLVGPPAPIRVMCHGDCRPKNIMFRYSDEGDIQEVCLLGFQMARYASPALDLATLFYCCTSHELRDNCLQQMLEEYQVTFTAHLQQLLGIVTPDSNSPEVEILLDPNKFLEMLLDEFHRCGRFGLAAALNAISDPNQTLDLNMTAPAYVKDDANGTQRPLVEKIITSSMASVISCRKVADVVKELVDNGDL